jgi:hypothetical protein
MEGERPEKRPPIRTPRSNRLRGLEVRLRTGVGIVAGIGKPT